MARHELLGIPVDAFSARREALGKAADNGTPVTFRAGRVVETIYPKQAKATWRRASKSSRPRR